MAASTTRIHTLELGPMENFIYLIEDTQTKCAAIVDPAWDADEICALAISLDVKITDILLTHSHYDHINAIDQILTRYDAELHLLHAEAQFWGQSLIDPSLHHGGDIITMGQTEITVLHTPGHTPGSACYRADEKVITGDTLFVFGCGRCDLSGGDPNQMFATLNKLRNELPTQTCILPGHNYAVKPTATMGEQIKGNPFMHFAEQEDFVKFRMQLHGQVRQSPYGEVNAKCAHEWLDQS